MGHVQKGDEPIDLDPFEVSARQFETSEDLMSAGVDLIDMENASRQATGSLGEALSWEPGVSSSFYGGGASRPVLRGMDGFRVGVYDSGLNTGDLSASSPDHAVAIEPLFVREIILKRGAAALHHGGGAIGGAVDTVPDFLPDTSTPQGWDAVTGALYNTVNEGRTTYLKGGYRDGELAIRVNLLERETEDYDIPGFSRTPDYDINNFIRLRPGVRGQVAPNSDGFVPNTWTRTHVGALGVGWIRKNSLFQGSYQRYETRYGVPLDGHTHGNPFGVPGVTGPSLNDGITIDLAQDRLLGQSRIKLDGEQLEHLEVKGAATRFRQTETVGSFLANDFSLDGGNSQLELGGQWGSWNVFTGVDLSLHDYENRNISYSAGRADQDLLETSSQNAAVYSLAQVELGETQFRVGGRYDWQDTSLEASETRGKVSRIHKTGSAVIEFEHSLSKSWQIILSLGNTARNPNAEELFIEAPHGATGNFWIPNDQLATERSRSADLRIQHRSGRFLFSANVFYREYDGYIYLENLGFEVDGLTAYTWVQRDAEFYGGEIDARWIFLSDPTWTGQLRIFSDFVHATDTEMREPLPRIPPMRLGTSVEFSSGNWTAELAALHAFEQDRVPREIFGTLAYQSPSEAYTLVTMRGERSFAFRDMTIRAGVEITNLLDEEARQHTSFLKDVAPLPGRSLQFSILIEF